MSNERAAPMAVAEHVFTLPMALAMLATVCGWVAGSHFFPESSPWKALLEKISTGMPILIAQAGQLWHSHNIRNKVAIANGTANGVSKDHR